MKCQILFSGKNKKNILKCRLLQILPRVLSVKAHLRLITRRTNGRLQIRAYYATRIFSVIKTPLRKIYFSRCENIEKNIHKKSNDKKHGVK